MEIVMKWNVLYTKNNWNKKGLKFRVQAIIILFDHQHVDIMFFFFLFPNNDDDDNDKTEVFF